MATINNLCININFREPECVDRLDEAGFG